MWGTESWDISGPAAPAVHMGVKSYLRFEYTIFLPPNISRAIDGAVSSEVEDSLRRIVKHATLQTLFENQDVLPYINL